MATVSTDRKRTAPGGLFDSVRSCLATWVLVLRTRVEIISTELEEQREWFEKLMIMAVASLFCLSLGLLLLTLFIVVCFWDSYRVPVLGGFALLYLGGGIWITLAMRNKIKAKPKFFATTIDELTKDHEQLATPKE